MDIEYNEYKLSEISTFQTSSCLTYDTIITVVNEARHIYIYIYKHKPGPFRIKNVVNDMIKLRCDRYMFKTLPGS